MRQKLTATWNILLLTSSSSMVSESLFFLLLHHHFPNPIHQKHSLDSCWNHSRLQNCYSSLSTNHPMRSKSKREKDDDGTNHTDDEVIFDLSVCRQLFRDVILVINTYFLVLFIFFCVLTLEVEIYNIFFSLH